MRANRTMGFSAMITLYVLCAIEFYIRYAKNLPVREVKLNGGDVSIRGYMDKHLLYMTIALAFSTTCLFIR